MKELREQIEQLKDQLAKGGQPEQLQLLQESVSNLEYAKKQTWEEKQNLSRKFEENRWVSLAKNGMLQFRVNFLKKQKAALEGKLSNVSTELELVYKELAKAKEETAQKQQELDALCSDVASMLQAENDKLHQLESTVLQLEEENTLLKKGVGVSPSSTKSHPTSQTLTEENLTGFVRDALSDPSLMPHGVKAADTLSDGVVLSKLVNRAVPGTIDERVLHAQPQSPEDVLENLTLFLNSAKAIGCNIPNTTLEDIITGDEHKLLQIVTEIERVTKTE